MIEGATPLTGLQAALQQRGPDVLDNLPLRGESGANRCPVPECDLPVTKTEKAEPSTCTKGEEHLRALMYPCLAAHLLLLLLLHPQFQNLKIWDLALKS